MKTQNVTTGKKEKTKKKDTARREICLEEFTCSDKKLYKLIKLMRKITVNI